MALFMKRKSLPEYEISQLAADGATAENEPKQHQLVEILDMLGNSEEIFDFVADKIFQNSEGEFKTVDEVKRYIKSAADEKPLELSKLIESRVGRGTIRTLSFMGTDPRAPKDVLKILEAKFKEESFEKKVDKGMYMGIMESYDVKWNFEKAARDIWQNFFDANGQTLDGIESKININTENNTAVIHLEGPQDYDWKELVHIGATNKEDIERSAGGFGEGAKILAFILLRDFDVREIKFVSRDWEIQYYLADVPRGSYAKKLRGLYVKKTKHEPIKGNALEMVAGKDTATAEFSDLQKAKELFYSKANPDFQKSNFDDRNYGGFKIRPPLPSYPYIGKGHFYMAGQRINYKSRDEWETVEGVDIWTWKKVITKDRDRGLITQNEMKKNVIPFVVGAMKKDEQIQAIYDFRPYWNRGAGDDVGYELQKNIVDILAGQGIKLKFEPEYLANDVNFFSRNRWIAEALGQKGYTICHGFLAKVGMKEVTKRFKELQEHIRMEATPLEKKKINILQEAARAMELGDADIKDVWVFGAESEKSIFHGQFNDMFYWMAKEALDGSFFDALHTYIHEVAHKDGPHGEAKFEYGLQEQIKKIQQFMSKKRSLYEKLEAEWSRAWLSSALIPILRWFNSSHLSKNQHRFGADFIVLIYEKNSAPQIRCLLRKAKPEPDFRYFSKSKAAFLFSNEQYQIRRYGALLEVYFAKCQL